MTRTNSMPRTAARSVAAVVAKVVTVAVALVVATVAATTVSHASYFRMPAIAGDTIVFVSEGDIWRVSQGGGAAQRITTHPQGRVVPCAVARPSMAGLCRTL